MRVIFGLISTIYSLRVHSGLEADANRLARCHGIDMSKLTISTTHTLYSDGKLTPLQLTECYIARINSLNPTLKAVLEMNPHASEWALPLGSNVSNKPLFGIPVLVKGSIGVKSLRASAGAAALESNVRDDADIIKKLREAGAIILGTSNLSELSGSRSYEAPEGWSQLGGQTLNPYNLNASIFGSSSGSAVAVIADLALVALGTETLGSTIAPASCAMVMGFKPTYSWTSTEGIIPMAPTLDTVNGYLINSYL
ncbi:hypothetical protein DSO57_1011192 [Entomophthora muscae]|uniref:Uncharacterized protein n=1 Tax=Entomophthora muscae TaxID=34485 RepID=A0ACC2UFW9_9FUNG|nr:hypothetical protein DSO57_1011192 [Entomophthora muscae]